eukprot:m.156607 g.156607  ORF g.156607 m.156607 type:complete len:819 (-) comp31009_c0_seq1:30-2486(-)
MSRNADGLVAPLLVTYDNPEFVGNEPASDAYDQVDTQSDGDEHGSGLQGKRKRLATHILGDWSSKVTQSVYESFDWMQVENKARDSILLHMPSSRLDSIKWEEAKIGVSRWILCCLIGCVVGISAWFVDFLIDKLSYVKFELIFTKLEDACKRNNSTDSYACRSSIWIVACLINVPLVYFAVWITTKYAPKAAGSGIAEVKCYLNGIRTKGWFNIETYVVKLLGVSANVVANMPVGKEGPMIHTGAIIGAGLSQGNFKFLSFPTHWFQNDFSKRDFAAVGAAAGLACAFGAILGGVLFVLEEGASFLTPGMIWRSLFTATIALLVLKSIQSSIAGDSNDVEAQGLFSFGIFPQSEGYTVTCINGTEGSAQVDGLWNSNQIPLFWLIAVLGGLQGAAWNQLQFRITLLRRKYRTTIFRQRMEAVLIAFVNTSLLYLFAQFVDTCQSTQDIADNTKYPWLSKDLRQGTCADDDHFSVLATLVFNDLGVAVKKFLHYPNFDAKACVLFYFVMFFMSCWTYGGAYPSGLFVPSIATGAAYGRLVGELLVHFGYTIDQMGTIVLMGSASFLAGVTRVTISLTAIFCESTNQVTFLLPLSFVMLIAKLTADFFNNGIYDIHIHLQQIPLLDWYPSTVIKRFTCEEAMSPNPARTLGSQSDTLITFPIRPTVEQIYGSLSSNTHNGFPVVGDNGTQFIGMICRSQLITLLKYKHWERNGEEVPFYLTEMQFTGSNKLTVEKLPIPEDSYDNVIDLSPYVDTTVLTAKKEMPLARAFQLVRYMGIRHLPICDNDNNVVGIVTRKDIDTHAVEHLNEQFELEQPQYR